MSMLRAQKTPVVEIEEGKWRECKQAADYVPQPLWVLKNVCAANGIFKIPIFLPDLYLFSFFET